MADPARESGSRSQGAAPGRLALTIAAVGVVFGDIGTSPLYALNATFSTEGIGVDRSTVHGVISLVLWTITVVVSLKYVTFVLRADNRGEGGVMALLGLVQKARIRNAAASGALVAAGLVGVSLFYGDGAITPAISVLSAVEGLEVAEPALEELVLPLTLGILTGLFAIQRFGTGAVGRLFGPITMLWFVALGASGLAEVVHHPGILDALSPFPAISFALDHGEVAFFTLAAVVLVVTGAEALYADLGHFGLPPIRMAWFGLVFPALTLQYLGQGSLILRSPEAIDGTLFLMFPEELRLPMVGLATAATVIASQALISGVFSVSRQANQMGFLPRLSIHHTSAHVPGQVYIPAMNWLLFVAVVVLVLGFRSSAALASAYGIAVTGTFVVTTVLLAVVARKVWEKPIWIVFAGLALILPVDLAFFSASLTKIADGGWLPLLIGAGLYTVLRTWKQGRDVVTESRTEMEGSLRGLVADLQWRRLNVQRVPGTGVFLNESRDTTPLALRATVEHMGVLPEQVIILTVRVEEHAFWDDATRVHIDDLGYRNDGITHVTGHYGFREEPDVPALLRLAARRKRIELTAPPEHCSYYLSRITLVRTHDRAAMAGWRKRLFVYLTHYAANPVSYFNLPRDRTVIMGAHLDL